MFKRSSEKTKSGAGRPEAAAAGRSGSAKPVERPATEKAAGRPSAATATAAAAVSSAGKQAYEAKRAAKAGVSLEKWMADKTKCAAAEKEAEQRARRKQDAAKPPGLLKRLLDRAHKPL